MENENITDTVNESLPGEGICKVPKKDNTPNIICAISAVLMYGVTFVADIVAAVKEGGRLYHFFLYRFGVNLFLGHIPPVSCGAIIIGLILLIYLRVKYPKHSGGKILMWVTIADVVLKIVFIIILFISCSAALSSFCSSCA